MNYENNRLYFFPTPIKKLGWKPFALIVVGIILFGTTSSMYGDTAKFINILAWGSLLGGIGWIVSITSTNGKRIVVTDGEYDLSVRNKFNSLNIMQIALERIGIDEDQLKEIPPVFFHGYRVDREAIEKIGADGKLRTSKYDITALFFSDTQVYIYQQVFDMLDGTKLEYTQEYFYRDIVSFSTSTKTSDKNSNDVKGVSTFLLKVPNDEFYSSIDGVSDADTIIGAVKQKLREKKR